MSAADLPEEVLAQLFNVCEPEACFRLRRVCRTWRALAAAGCIRVRNEFPKLPRMLLADQRFLGDEHTAQHIWRMELVGHRATIQRASAPAAAAAAAAPDAAGPAPGAAGFSRERWLNRTKGHLPTPVAMDASEERTSEPPMAIRSVRDRGSAVRVELGGAGAGHTVLRSLDLAASKFRPAFFAQHARHPPCPKARSTRPMPFSRPTASCLRPKWPSTTNRSARGAG
jgi:hypothetical protein